MCLISFITHKRMLSLFRYVFLASVLFVGICQAGPLNEDDEDSRIVKGKIATPGQYPFAVSLQDGDAEYHTHSCTVSLITPKTCLGAAHCAVNYYKNKEPYAPLCGIFGSTEQTSQSVCHPVSKTHVHEGYVLSLQKIDNDFATFIFSQDMVKLYKDSVSIVPLLAAGTEITECCVTTMGWGNLKSVKDKDSPKDLHYIELKITSRSYCNDADETKLCLSTEGKGICSGDSGGPSIIVRNDVQIQVAVTSAVATECGSGYSLLMNVGHFNKWITDHSDGTPTFQPDNANNNDNENTTTDNNDNDNEEASN